MRACVRARVRVRVRVCVFVLPGFDEQGIGFCSGFLLEGSLERTGMTNDWGGQINILKNLGSHRYVSG